MKLGILGGMGPLATAEFFRKVVTLTEAGSDQEHIRVLMDDNPQIPDRTAFILGEGDDPTRALVRSALRLEYMGADFVAIPCNTAHKFHSAIQSFLDIPVLNMVELTAEHIRATYPRAKKVLLLATSGTYAAGLYNFALASKGLELLVPPEGEKRILMRWIYDLKKKGILPETAEVRGLIDKSTGGEAVPVILGCTELPVIFDRLQLEGDFIDTTTVLAKACVRLGKKESMDKSDPNIA